MSKHAEPPPSHSTGSDVETGVSRNSYLGEDARGTSHGNGGRLPRMPAANRLASLEQHEAQADRQPATKHDAEPVAWRDLPKKKQLIILTLARVSDPLVQTSLQTEEPNAYVCHVGGKNQQSYMYYQLKWFNPESPEALISSQAGVLHASFTAAQFLTAMAWGRVADSPRAGRKTVLLIGLLGTSLSCLGFGFSTSFWQALAFRTLGGSTNGNSGVMRTMVSEIVREKKFQARAFLLLPMTFNISVIVGPILGGLLSDPAGTYPGLFGHIPFFVNFPYATPNILSAAFLLLAAAAVWLGLDETLDSLQDAPLDLGSRVGSQLAGFFRRVLHGHAGKGYVPISSDELQLTSYCGGGQAKVPKRRYTQQLPFRQIFTRNVLLTLFAQFFLSFHLGTFNSLWFVFLSTPVFDPSASKHKLHLPFLFTGGIGMHPQSVGAAMAILGIIGITLQLFLYPRNGQDIRVAKSNDSSQQLLATSKRTGNRTWARAERG
ncbi:hypothetical protein ED733_008841 [Metarhizium rileyi]|uniref:Major facilitator superfamily domain, general substrate transporter n=1 Tax=Metarhizium rileyi (strain RCEF 4871) TaxID=1649241 RepID=A0A5C6GQ44_METRR|nr:hypothetical protein ED733_008841 [Metarhizium rileyi]